MWSWKERERTRKRGRRRTQILRHNGGDGKNEDKDWEEECVGVNFRWKKKMLQGLSAEYTHKQTYVNTAHRAPLPHSSFCHMTQKKKQKKQNTKPTGHKTYKELSWQRHTHPCTDAHTHDLTARPDTPVSSVCNKRRVSFKETNTLHVYVRLCREAGKPEVTPKAIHLIRLPITKRRSRAG